MRERLMEEWLRELRDVDLRALTSKHSAVYLYSARMLDERCRSLRASMPPEVDIYYSIKANPNVHITRRLAGLVEGAEVSSAGELSTALAAGFSPSRIMLVGPAKTPAELQRAIELGLHAIVVESVEELTEIADAAEEQEKRVRVLLRLNPERRQHGARLTMTGVSSQFGMDRVALPRALDIARERASSLQFEGFHVYLGTRFLDAGHIAANTESIIDLCLELERAHGVQSTSLDIGGGLGVPYFEGEAELDLAELGARVADVVRRKVGTRSLRLLMETGRYLVADAGLYATRVRYRKESRGESWVITYGGINHFYASAFMGQLLRRNFPMAVLTGSQALRAPSEHPVNVCGPLCTPGDLLASNARLADAGPDDVIGIFSAGAYSFSTSPQLFLSHDAPAELMVEDGRLRLIRPVRRAEDVLAEQLALCDSYRPPEIAFTERLE